MRQILLLILLFFAGSWIARKLRQAQEHAQARTGRGAGYDGTPGAGAGSGRPNRDARALPEPMVRCAECGVHAPKGDAVAAGGEYFCSAEHAQRHAARTSGQDAR
ncbi:pyrimidine deaminase [Burkholderia contaminans FFH2055]|uniref:Deaminase n=1 Tax=Burkholderia contaminans TaxID=488447 RepID=A0A3N8QYC9_9BURK|nr:PP0621 family protein [Burkholderia contaminans]AKM42414.1 pyrimidine deaminase [Burkholderia contaminans]KKL37724.1 pyrimidine deaminase [Burkholderia contaminans FFH2055]MCA8154026.1 deaminase [Burkholderia contaminans]MEB4633336.1 PP0621 family protein [Burkholderia contaminans]MEB4641580.1 PP0621 family protein [Burkholderia contaminans]